MAYESDREFELNCPDRVLLEYFAHECMSTVACVTSVLNLLVYQASEAR